MLFLSLASFLRPMVMRSALISRILLSIRLSLQSYYHFTAPDGPPHILKIPLPGNTSQEMPPLHHTFFSPPLQDKSMQYNAI